MAWNERRLVVAKGRAGAAIFVASVRNIVVYGGGRRRRLRIKTGRNVMQFSV